MMRVVFATMLCLTWSVTAKEPQDPLGLGSRPFQKSKTIEQSVKSQAKDQWQFATPSQKPREPLGAVSAPKGTDPLKAASSPKGTDPFKAQSAAAGDDPLKLRSKPFTQARSQFQVQRDQKSPAKP